MNTGSFKANTEWDISLMGMFTELVSNDLDAIFGVCICYVSQWLCVKIEKNLDADAGESPGRAPRCPEAHS